MTDFEWQQECKYIDSLMPKQGRVSEMNRSKATFVRYCVMQRDQATREWQDDAAQYIQHCIDDLMKGNTK